MNVILISIIMLVLAILVAYLATLMVDWYDARQAAKRTIPPEQQYLIGRSITRMK